MTGSRLTQPEKLLMLIEQASRGTEMVWMPPSGRQERLKFTDELVLVDGGGDASALRAMERRDWIKSVPKLGRYCYTITEDGCIQADAIRQRELHR